MNDDNSQINHPENCVNSGGDVNGLACASLSPEEMATILESTPAGIAIVKNRVFGWTNDVLCSMLGYAFPFLAGKNARIIYPGQEEYDQVGRELYPGLENYGFSVVETRLQRQNGSILDCRIRASRMDKDDPSKGIVIVVTDISEHKLLQLQLHQSQKMEAIGVLAGGISHDFNNILMGIQGHLSLMQIDVTDADKIINHANQIGRLVKTASELTGRLLGFARGGKYHISVISINELVSQTLNLFKPVRKGVLVHEEYEGNLCNVNADRSQLEQVFLNLFINASQAMPDQGEIFISSKNIDITSDHNYPFEVTPGPYVQVEVRDTGVGMDSETQQKIFDPFFSTKEAGDQKGRGLGLSTVFGIIKNHGGFILVDSQKGKGAKFTVCLPASDKVRVKKIENDLKSIDQMRKGSETILLVDDEESVINVGKNFLLKLGYKPLIARNGFEAVEIFKLYKDEISLTVLDLIMPKMSGQQVLAEIKNIQEDAKVLISSGYSVDDSDEDALSRKCSGFIRKPYSMDDFANVLRKILDKSL